MVQDLIAGPAVPHQMKSSRGAQQCRYEVQIGGVGLVCEESGSGGVWQRVSPPSRHFDFRPVQRIQHTNDQPAARRQEFGEMAEQGLQVAD